MSTSISCSGKSSISHAAVESQVNGRSTSGWRWHIRFWEPSTRQYTSPLLWVVRQHIPSMLNAAIVTKATTFSSPQRQDGTTLAAQRKLVSHIRRDTADGVFWWHGLTGRSQTLRSWKTILFERPPLGQVPPHPGGELSSVVHCMGLQIAARG